MKIETAPKNGDVILTDEGIVKFYEGRFRFCDAFGNLEADPWYNPEPKFWAPMPPLPTE